MKTANLFRRLAGVATVALAAFELTGCHLYRPSAIPGVVSRETALNLAAPDQQIKISGGSSSSEVDMQASRYDYEMQVTFGAGTSEQLMRAYFKELGTLIINGGGKVADGAAFTKLGTNMDFTMTYDCGDNRGLVNVHSSDKSTNEVEIKIKIEEKRR